MPVPFVNDNYRETDVPINWYPAGDQDFKVILYGDLGLQTLFTPQASAQIRCMRDNSDFLYVLSGENFYKVDKSFNCTLLGNVSNKTGPAWIETNRYQMAVCDGAHLFVYVIATGVWQNVTAPLGIGASSFTYQDLYGAFVDPDTQNFYITTLNDFATIDPLSYAAKEGWPDNLKAIIMNYRELWLIGTDFTEFWYDAGGTSTNPFPFQRIGGPGIVPQGIGARASVRRYDNGVIFLSSNREVLYFTGYQPQVISTPKMSRELENYPSVEDAFACDYYIGGHPFYCLNFPSANATWVWDNRVKAWHKRSSWQTLSTPAQGRWRGNYAFYWDNYQLVGDYENGKVYWMSPDFLDDDGWNIVRTLYSQEIFNKGKPVDFAGLQVLFNHGVSPTNTDPYSMLSWSDDGGRNWSNEHWRSAGKVGEYSKRCRWLKLGQAKQSRIFKLQVSASQKWDILSFDQVT